MEHFPIILLIWSALTYLSKVPTLDEVKRRLKDEVDNCNARVLDVERDVTRLQRGKKRKRDDTLSDWKAKGKKLVDEAQCLLGQDGRWRCFVMGKKLRWDVSNLLAAFGRHQKKVNGLLTEASSVARRPYYGTYLPVKTLVGQVASWTLNQLKLLLEGDEVGRIAVHGKEGIGKTFLMKHLNNWALNNFAYVFWVPTPVGFTIKSVQDALADMLCFTLASDETSSTRATRLSKKLSSLGSFVIFLDGIPEADFSLEEVGIPVPIKGSECKLVITTSSTTLGCRMLNSVKKVEVPCLSNEDACELFMQKANIGTEFDSSLDGIPSLLAERCCGVPRMIENIASDMWGLHDPCEWKSALYELDGPRMKKKSRLLLYDEEAPVNRNI